jgi:acid phosphatase (class A)
MAARAIGCAGGERKRMEGKIHRAVIAWVGAEFSVEEHHEFFNSFECALCARVLLVAFAGGGLLLAQTGSSEQAGPAPAVKVKARKTPYFVDPGQLNLAPILPAPPAQDSAATKAELAELHRMEQGRTPAQKAAAEFDDKDEDMFLYANVLGVGFNADALPLTAALSAHLRNDVSIVNGPLKARFGRPRPYHFDHTLHPICETNKENSYPSGHAFNGYAYGLTLAEMVPEKSAEILARADAYARNRMVCEAHYASDLEASRRAAYALFGYLEGNARFQAELTAARTETRRALHLEDGQASHGALSGTIHEPVAVH